MAQNNQEIVVFSGIKDDCQKILYGVAKKHFKGKDYNATFVATYISQSNEETINTLIKYNRNFKYIVKTMVVQKKNTDGSKGQMEMSANCFWN